MTTVDHRSHCNSKYSKFYITLFLLTHAATLSETAYLCIHMLLQEFDMLSYLFQFTKESRCLPCVPLGVPTTFIHGR